MSIKIDGKNKFCEGKVKKSDRAIKNIFKNIIPICAALALTFSCATAKPKNKIEEIEEKVKELQQRIEISKNNTNEIIDRIIKRCDFYEYKLKEEQNKGEGANILQIKNLETKINACNNFYKMIIKQRYGIADYVPSKMEVEKFLKENMTTTAENLIEEIVGNIRLFECTVEQCVQSNAPNTVSIEYKQVKVLIPINELLKYNLNSVTVDEKTKDYLRKKLSSFFDIIKKELENEIKHKYDVEGEGRSSFYAIDTEHIINQSIKDAFDKKATHIINVLFNMLQQKSALKNVR